MPNEGAMSLQRSWTCLGPHVHRTHKHIRVPTPNTYRTQLEYCHQLYTNLHLQDHYGNGIEATDFALPSVFQTRGLTFSPVYYARSAPATAGHSLYHSNRCSSMRQTSTSTVPQTRSSSKADDRKCRSHASSAVTVTENGEQKKKRVDPVFLSEHLRTHGYGEPILRRLQTDPFCRRVPSGRMTYGLLPKSPSDREKIKGKARLDYEMANMRAMAFCEQQNSKKPFRTASANMRNRDVQFVEEEMREQVQRGDDIDDDTDSVVFMAMTRDELEEKVMSWMIDVDQSFESK